MDFVRRAMPDGWLHLADELHRAAEILWNSPDAGVRLEAHGLARLEDSKVINEVRYRMIKEFSRTYFLLAGYAIENLAKGLLVAENPQYITGGELSRDLIDHRLSRLLKKLEILELSESENRFVSVAQRAIPYWGRYPVPRKSEGIQDDEPLTEELRQGYLQLRYRLRSLLDQVIKNGWDSGVGARIPPSY